MVTNKNRVKLTLMRLENKTDRFKPEGRSFLLSQSQIYSYSPIAEKEVEVLDMVDLYENYEDLIDLGVEHKNSYCVAISWIHEKEEEVKPKDFVGLAELPNSFNLPQSWQDKTQYMEAIA